MLASLLPQHVAFIIVAGISFRSNKSDVWLYNTSPSLVLCVGVKEIKSFCAGPKNSRHNEVGLSGGIKRRCGKNSPFSLCSGMPHSNQLYSAFSDYGVIIRYNALIPKLYLLLEVSPNLFGISPAK